MAVRQAGSSSAWEPPAHVPVAQQPEATCKKRWLGRACIKVGHLRAFWQMGFYYEGSFLTLQPTELGRAMCFGRLSPMGCCNPNAPHLRGAGARWPGAAVLGCVGWVRWAAHGLGDTRERPLLCKMHLGCERVGTQLLFGGGGPVCRLTWLAVGFGQILLQIGVGE